MEPRKVKLKPIEVTPETFKEFGQVIQASPDGEEFGPDDAQLDLTRGIPRFYIMHLQDRPLKFSTITHHASVTQCLGSIGGQGWYLGVSKPAFVDSSVIKAEKDANILQSHVVAFMCLQLLIAYGSSKSQGLSFSNRIRELGMLGHVPLFKPETMDFYNLELSNTNVVDHTTYNFRKENAMLFLLDE